MLLELLDDERMLSAERRLDMLRTVLLELLEYGVWLRREEVVDVGNEAFPRRALHSDCREGQLDFLLELSAGELELLCQG